MRKYILAAFVIFVMIGITVYLFITLNPVDIEKLEQVAGLYNLRDGSDVWEFLLDVKDRGVLMQYLDPEKLLVVIGMLSLSIFVSLTYLFALADKLLILKFYESPRIALAARRSAWIVVGLWASLFYELYAAEFYLTAITWLFLLIIEVLFSKAFAERRSPNSNKIVSIASPYKEAVDSDS